MPHLEEKNEIKKRKKIKKKSKKEKKKKINQQKLKQVEALLKIQYHKHKKKSGNSLKSPFL